jgi:lipopolysaccharide export LptBFGC system permease protein LptF
MHACGLSKAVLVKAAMILALFTGIVAAVNVMWAGPCLLVIRTKCWPKRKPTPAWRR